MRFISRREFRRILQLVSTVREGRHHVPHTIRFAQTTIVFKVAGRNPTAIVLYSTVASRIVDSDVDFRSSSIERIVKETDSGVVKRSDDDGRFDLIHNTVWQPVYGHDRARSWW
jgi:hypothetical protein